MAVQLVHSSAKIDIKPSRFNIGTISALYGAHIAHIVQQSQFNQCWVAFFSDSERELREYLGNTDPFYELKAENGWEFGLNEHVLKIMLSKQLSHALDEDFRQELYKVPTVWECMKRAFR